MADIRVLTATDRNVLHRADTGAIRFQVKVPLPGLGPTVTFASRERPITELYKIIIGRQTKFVNMTTTKKEVTIYPVSTMDFGVFQEFWITWYNKKIRMGLKQERKPFLVYPVQPDNVIGYIMFHTMDKNWAPVEWMVESSPVILEPMPHKVFEDRIRWAPMEFGKLPEDAMIGGFENEPIYIARAVHNGSLCPGKYTPSTGLAYVAWGHREHSKKEFQILCGFNAVWHKTHENFIPTNAFVGGRSDVRGEPLYIGRAIHDGNLITGKVHMRYKTCYLPYQGEEIETDTYEILTIPHDAIPQAISLDMLDYCQAFSDS